MISCSIFRSVFYVFSYLCHIARFCVGQEYDIAATLTQATATISPTNFSSVLVILGAFTAAVANSVQLLYTNEI